ncbi:ABC transporter permease [Variovorax rhizosphaerae]|uniref:ABC transporter permease n=1 Tax=Variovorax rhizosphaerae TaxID=1836200 RepID=A0ABU8WTM1_9BURK
MAFLILPAALLVMLTLLAPMALLGRISLNLYDAVDLMKEALTPLNYVNAFADPYYRAVLGNSLLIAITCTVLTLMLALAPAYWLSRLGPRWKSPVMIVTLLPLMVGNVVRSAGWMALLGTQGAVNTFLVWGGLSDGPVKMMSTTGAVVVGIVSVVLPYMILTVSSVIDSVSSTVEEAASNLGAGPLTVFRRVVAPLAAPGIAAGCVLTFILCINAYATPVLLGGARFKMMAPAVFDQFTRAANWPFGAALAIILLITTLLMTIAGNYFLSRRYVVSA